MSDSTPVKNRLIPAGAQMMSAWLINDGCIEKLHGENWTTWRFQMCHILKGRGLWKLVEGTVELADSATPAVRDDFERKMDKAFSTMVVAIAPAQLYLITSTKTPNEAWRALCNHFERDTLTNRIFLKKKYFRMEMREGSSLQQHLKEMKELTDKLSMINCEISEEDQVVTLLGSLPKSYATLVTTLEARTGQLGLAAVQQALIHEEMKMNNQSSASRDGDSALVGAYRKKPREKKVGRSSAYVSRCFRCGQPGHFQRECPNNPQKQTQQVRRAAHTVRVAGAEDSDECCFTLTHKNGARGDKWLIDSGASSHMSWNKSVLLDYQVLKDKQCVTLGDGRQVEAIGHGRVRLSTHQGDGSKGIMSLQRVLHVPSLAVNLFSVKVVTEKGGSVEFKDAECKIRNQKNAVKAVAYQNGTLFELHCTMDLAELASAASEKMSDMDLWHRRLAHVNRQLLSIMMKGDQVKGLKGLKATNPGELSFCEGCVQGKLSKKPFKPSGIHTTRKLQLIHSDVCGPMKTESVGGKKYFVTFTDDYTRCTSSAFLKNKSEVLAQFKQFEAKATSQSGNQIGTLRTDNGGEYTSKEFEEYLVEKGIHHETSIPYTPEQNGVAERLNRTLCEKAKAMMVHAGLDDRYWAEAVQTATYIKNRLPTRSLEHNVTPYELWYGRKPDLSHIRVFGCTAYALVPDTKRRKFDVRLRCEIETGWM